MSPSIRVLGSADQAAFLALAADDPIVNVFAEHRARLTQLQPRWLGGEMWGRFRGPDMVAACHVGANLVPVACTPEDAAAFAERAARRPRGAMTIVGPQSSVEAMWSVLQDRWRGEREIRWNQSHMALSAAPAMAPDPLVTKTAMGQLSVVYPACVAMYTEEVGVSPEEGGGRDLYRTRVSQLIARGWSFSRIENGQVVFKAEVACASPSAAQIQGVWVAPDRRGEGLAVSGMAAVAEHVRRDIAPTVSLYVNCWNRPALRAYERVGFVETERFATVMF